MEPIRLWRNAIDGITLDWGEDRAGMHEIAEDGATEGVWLPRADFDALVKRDQTCPLCGDELDPDEADYDSVCPPEGAGVCSQCFGRWYDAPLYEKRAAAATARADAASDRLARAEALLREAYDAIRGEADFPLKDRIKAFLMEKANG